MQRMKLDHYLTPHTKITSKWIKDVKIRSETIKLLKESIGSKLFDISNSNFFSGYVSPSKGNRSKNK